MLQALRFGFGDRDAGLGCSYSISWWCLILAGLAFFDDKYLNKRLVITRALSAGLVYTLP